MVIIGRTDKGKNRLKYEQKQPTGYKSLIQGANRTGAKISLTVSEYEEIKLHPCKFCGSQSAWTGNVVNGDSGALTVDSCVSCCSTCKRLVNCLGFDAFVEHSHRISRNLISSASPNYKTEEEQKMANWDKDKHTYHEDT
jgi:hypothetical protein